MRNERIHREECCSKQDFESLLRTIEKEEVGPPNYLEHKETLDDLYFTRKSWFRQGGAEKRAFLIFYEKYSAKWQKPSTGSRRMLSEEVLHKRRQLGLPEKYSPKFCRNFAIIPEKLPRRSLPSLSESEIEAFGEAVQLFELFLQKKALAALRKKSLTTLQLPIRSQAPDILKALETHDVILIAGDTGSGKSTQVAQILLESEKYNNSRIVCTQPRRLAATSLARRVADEMMVSVGDKVGYQVRFDSERRGRRTQLLFVTEGILLRHMTNDKLLEQYDIIIVDEVHERSLTTDFLLGCLRTIFNHRKFKWILMSATINIESFQSWLPQCATVQIPGRLFPIHTTQLSEDEIANDVSVNDTTRLLRTNPFIKTLLQIERDFSGETGDVLIFVSGVAEIDCLIADIRSNNELQNTVTLPLHAGMHPEDQDKVFKPLVGGKRKIVVSTNVAETSVTVEGIRCVIDSGKVKTMTYVPHLRTSSLQEDWISKSSASQRQGRAGRTGPGRCYRLYSKEEYSLFDDFTKPEIHRTPLDNVLLQIVSLGLCNVKEFPFLEQPDKAIVEVSISNLIRLNCIALPQGSSTHKTTPLGSLVSQLPVDIEVGRMLVVASILHQNCSLPAVLDNSLTLAAALSLSSHVFLREKSASSTVQEYDSPLGDLFTVLNIYNQWQRLKRNQIRKWCADHYVDERKLIEMQRVRNQFKKALQEGIQPLLNMKSRWDRKRAKPETPNMEVLLLGILSYGLPQNIATLAHGTTGSEVRLCTSERDDVQFHPSGVFFEKNPFAGSPSSCIGILYQRLLETRKAYLVTTVKVFLPPVLLLTADDIDVGLDSDGTDIAKSIIVNNEFLITFISAEVKREALSLAISLRLSIDDAVLHVTSKTSSIYTLRDNLQDCPELVPDWLRAPFNQKDECNNCSQLLDQLLSLPLSYVQTVTRLPRDQIIRMTFPASFRSSNIDFRSISNLSDYRHLKYGIQVCPFVRYAALCVASE